jgi:hypothetical protein
MGLKGLGIGCDGAAVEAGGIVKAVLGVGYVAGVKEGSRIGWVGGEPGIELGLGGLPIGFGDESFGIQDRGCGGLRRGGGGLGFRIRG